ncbi:MAG: amidohydrolase family protein [Pseudomonadota bacterium]
MHPELRALQRADLPNDYLLHAATLVSAELAGRADERGGIEPGKLADFLILNANPHADIANRQRIETVVNRGVAIPHSALQPER